MLKISHSHSTQVHQSEETPSNDVAKIGMVDDFTLPHSSATNLTTVKMKDSFSSESTQESLPWFDLMLSEKLNQTGDPFEASVLGQNLSDLLRVIGEDDVHLRFEPGNP